MENNACSEFKMRSTKIKDRNKINLLMKWSDNSFLCISADFCATLIIIQEKVIKIGFLCPYCLQTYASIQHMHCDHLPLHIGPVVCTSCKVIKNNSEFFLFKSWSFFQVQFSDQAELQTHKKTCNFVCEICDKTFASNYKYVRHCGTHVGKE